MSRDNQQTNKLNIIINLPLKIFLSATIILVLAYQSKDIIQNINRQTESQGVDNLKKNANAQAINKYDTLKNQFEVQTNTISRKLASFDHKRFEQIQDMLKIQNDNILLKKSEKSFKKQNEEYKRFNENQLSNQIKPEQQMTQQVKKINKRLEGKMLTQKLKQQQTSMRQAVNKARNNYNQNLYNQQIARSNKLSKPQSESNIQNNVFSRDQNVKIYSQVLNNNNLKYSQTVLTNQRRQNNNLLGKNIENIYLKSRNAGNIRNKPSNENEGIQKINKIERSDNVNKYEGQKNIKLRPPMIPQDQKNSSQLVKIVNITYLQLQLAKSLFIKKYESDYIKISEIQRQYYEQKYKISQYPEQPFCIVVPTYNNAENDRYIHNINSILQQDYSNYRIIVIDDASDDGTGQKLIQFAMQHQISEQKLQIVINMQRKMAMNNIYNAANSYCKPYQIFIILDGDDELIGRYVLKLFNSQFQSKNYWLAYSNFLTISGYIGYSRPYKQTVIDQNLYRNTSFGISHLRAFYTKLLTLINIQDLKDQNGKWLRAANDVAMFIPIAEMVHTKIGYMAEICYFYNSNTGLNNHIVKKDQQKRNQIKIRSKNAYNPIQQLFTEQEKEALKDSLSRKIDIKDYTIPLVQFQGKKYSWEI